MTASASLHARSSLFWRKLSSRTWTSLRSYHSRFDAFSCQDMKLRSSPPLILSWCGSFRENRRRPVHHFHWRTTDCPLCHSNFWTNALVWFLPVAHLSYQQLYKLYFLLLPFESPSLYQFRVCTNQSLRRDIHYLRILSERILL